MRLNFLAAVTALLASPAAATWTIVAVDQRTGEVGSAGASCTPFVAGVVRLVPGKGAVVAQARSNMEAKAKAAELIAAGLRAKAIVRAVSDKTYDPDVDMQQYGLAVLGAGHVKPSAAAFTGRLTPKSRGQLVANGVSVQGNILVSDQVLPASFDAYRNAERAGLSLAERLMLALEAGSRAGGDARCGRKTAQSAYLGVAKPHDKWNRPSLRIVVTTEMEQLDNPVVTVRRRYESQQVHRR